MRLATASPACVRRAQVADERNSAAVFAVIRFSLDGKRLLAVVEGRIYVLDAFDGAVLRKASRRLWRWWRGVGGVTSFSRVGWGRMGAAHALVQGRELGCGVDASCNAGLLTSHALRTQLRTRLRQCQGTHRTAVDVGRWTCAEPSRLVLRHVCRCPAWCRRGGQRSRHASQQMATTLCQAAGTAPSGCGA